MDKRDGHFLLKVSAVPLRYIVHINHPESCGNAASDSVQLAWDLIIWISNELSGDADGCYSTDCWTF